MARPDTYSRTQISLHWLIAALVFFQLIFHEGMEQAFHAKMDGISVAPVNPHVVAGLLVLALVIWRIILRLTRGTPPQPTKEPTPLRWLAVTAHWAFYVLLFVLPISGISTWFFGSGPAHIAHLIAKNALIALIVLHIIGALAHQFWFRTNVMRRIIGRA